MGECETTGIAAEVRDILFFHLGVEEALIKGDVRLVDLGADSLDVIEIAMSCEETFDIDISAKAAAKFVTFSDVVDFIEAHFAKGTDLAQSPRLVFAKLVGFGARMDQVGATSIGSHHCRTVRSSRRNTKKLPPPSPG